MSDFIVPPPLPYSPSRARNDILSAVMKAARQFGADKTALIDVDGSEVSYKNLLRGAFGLGASFKRALKKDEVVGIMLPTGAGVAIAICAVLASGRLPAMLNFTSGIANLKSAITTAKITKVVTARRFIDLADLQALTDQIGEVAELVYLEDLRDGLTLTDKLSALVGPRLPRLFRKRPRYSKPGVILFTSGTEGVPKGVVLSHQNVVSNVEQVRAHIGLSTESDIVFNPLPAFHCFGLTVGVFLPLMSGVRAVCHPTPLQPREIAARIGDVNATLLLATDTFISQYARASDGSNLKSVRLAVCGAERVKDETRQLVHRKFGIEILEGYGATEAAPVIAANSIELNKPGTVGKLMSDMDYELAPVDGITEGGRLRIKGPNVMLGYMRATNPGVIEPLPEGWHDTGDIVAVDDDKCIRIMGRVKRFAKIGGEMVSLAVVENCANAIWPDDMHAAAAIPDPRKGEQIVLLTTQPEAGRAEILAWAQSHGVSELSVPRKVFLVEEIPVLGTGKTDYGTVNKLVAELTST